LFARRERTRGVRYPQNQKTPLTWHDLMQMRCSVLSHVVKIAMT
jgi:hypothetical protein